MFKTLSKYHAECLNACLNMPMKVKAVFNILHSTDSVNSVTCSGLSPGGTQAYSSRAQPESSSDVEFLWKSYISLVTVFSISRGMTVTTCSSRGHLQWRQIFLNSKENNYQIKQQSILQFVYFQKKIPVNSHDYFGLVNYQTFKLTVPSIFHNFKCIRINLNITLSY